MVQRFFAVLRLSELSNLLTRDNPTQCTARNWLLFVLASNHFHVFMVYIPFSFLFLFKFLCQDNIYQPIFLGKSVMWYSAYPPLNMSCYILYCPINCFSIQLTLPHTHTLKPCTSTVHGTLLSPNLIIFGLLSKRPQLAPRPTHSTAQ